MVIEQTQYEQLVDQNLLEQILLCNGFKLDDYKTFSKKIERKKFVVKLGSNIQFFISGKICEKIKGDIKPFDFWYHLENIKFI